MTYKPFDLDADFRPVPAQRVCDYCRRSSRWQAIQMPPAPRTCAAACATRKRKRKFTTMAWSSARVGPGVAAEVAQNDELDLLQIAGSASSLKSGKQRCGPAVAPGMRDGLGYGHDELAIFVKRPMPYRRRQFGIRLHPRACPTLDIKRPLAWAASGMPTTREQKAFLCVDSTEKTPKINSWNYFTRSCVE